ncbi:vacuolar membrane alkaline phosphatase [Schizosaccharomyces cryophilus OY26]|uniref:Alkaline phosphatase n=1 Tax=Schizosaccharomyces cryophilus (strain OY26 / ATCC MYA-4695 / CBS 11777 / NBRC 106824 / NRRL Y48691) TaxID=653667 RepID=S9VW01_SCHCR|nr:vacuolar membrane alkaline phosphatase [Schizosaccharomyces cryophilus OY26]EPY50384.1 vacuolar membrane alkaline phosphatase [Schizosaccharomyces cryophilus OY26]
MANEHDYLLPVHEQDVGDHPNRVSWKLKKVHYILLSVALMALGFFFLMPFLTKKVGPKPKYAVMMVSDGMGPASLSMSRSFAEYISGEKNYILPLDKHLIGSSRTKSSSSLITDSAAGATAFSCAAKSYNGAVGVLDGGRACGTILEAAKEAGYLTGMVVTSRITDATPASFSAHAANRFMQSLIAEYQVGMGPLGRSTDLMFGGGLCSFLPNSSYQSCRSDDLDLLEYAKDNQEFNILLNRTDFDDSEKHQLPLLGLFADHHMDYNVDRDPKSQPSLTEMVESALDTLYESSKATGKGFFLLIEGSRIDMASHNNDPVAHVHDVLEYNSAFQKASDFIEKTGGVLISTSDHETGGLTVGRQITPEYPEYLWRPEVLARATHSFEYLARSIMTHEESELRSFIESAVFPALGIKKPSHKWVNSLYTARSNVFELINRMSLIISEQAQIGYTTHGHTAVDVNVYGSGDAVHNIKGNLENIEIGAYLEKYLGLSLDTVTSKLTDAPIYGSPDRGFKADAFVHEVLEKHPEMNISNFEDYLTSSVKNDLNAEL